MNGQNNQKCLPELELKPFNPEVLKAQHEAEVLKSFEAFLDLEKLQNTNLEFLFEGFLPFEYLLVLTAEAGEGKTTLAYGLAKTAIKKGIKVVYLDADNSLPFIKQNLEDFGLIGELKERLFILSRQLVDLSINKDNPYWKAVKRLLKSVRRCFVIVDTLGAFTRGYDPNSDKDMREVMSELKEIRDMGHAVLVLHHIQKYASIDGK
ncbi:MAG: AAA family ATPase, partial [Thermofilaceae archaeon]